jgi:hypothetical protein
MDVLTSFASANFLSSPPGFFFTNLSGLGDAFGSFLPSPALGSFLASPPLVVVVAFMCVALRCPLLYQPCIHTPTTLVQK